MPPLLPRLKRSIERQSSNTKSSRDSKIHAKGYWCIWLEVVAGGQWLLVSYHVPDCHRIEKLLYKLSHKETWIEYLKASFNLTAIFPSIRPNSRIQRDR